jgi:hypothetical protein
MFTRATSKRYCQFTLRALLIGTTICAAALGGLWYALEPIRRETEAVGAIRRAAAIKVDPDALIPPGCGADYLPPTTAYDRATCWLARAPGRVRALGVYGDAPVQELLRRLDSFGELYELRIDSEAFVDADVARLGKLRHLKLLQVFDAGIRGEGLASLAELPALEYLCVSSERLDESALSGVSHCQGLKCLSLQFDSWQPIDARAISHLRRLPRLEKLLIEGHVSDEMLLVIAEIPTLQSLDIRNRGLSDQGIAHLRDNPSIEKFYVRHSPDVTDESIAVFASMSSLKELYLSDTNVTAAGIRSLAASRPDITVTH